MKIAKYILGLWIFTITLSISSCSSAEKAAHERRNLMMPKKSDLKKNQKYKPAKEKKTYKPSKR